MSGQKAVAGAYRERNSTADRALDILAMFTDSSPVITGTDVGTRLGVAKSTAYRYLQSLVTNRFLEEAPGGGFRLGLRVLELARVARKSYGITELATPVMQDLAAKVHETVLLTRRVDDLVVCLERAESETHRVRISYERGSTLPVNAGASALVLLAWNSPEEASAVLRSAPLRQFTPATLTDVDQLLERFAQIRTDGYSISRSEVDHGVLGIAAPIRDGNQKVVAAVSVVAVAARVDEDFEREIIGEVLAAAEEISSRTKLLTG